MNGNTTKQEAGRLPETGGEQGDSCDSLRVIRVASAVRGDVEDATSWFKNHALPAFDYKTPQTLVAEGRADDLIGYIQSLEAGFAG